MRLKVRLVGCCLAAVLLVSALAASSASAKLPETKYIALGDSLAFGYSQEKFEVYFPKEGLAAFEKGYAERLGKKLAKLEKEAGNNLETYNLSCPGELSDGLIGHNPALGGGSGSEYNPCPWHNEDGLPRHFEYGSVSQLEAAVGLVSAAPSATKDVTINIGSNDELKIVAMCKNPEYIKEQGFKGGLPECLNVEAGPEGHFYSGGLFHHIIANTGDVIGVLRSVGYEGPVGVLGFYNPQTFHLPGSDALQKALNEAFESTISKGELGPGVVYANPFPFINPQGNFKKEEKTICKYTEECNARDIEVNNKKQEEKGEEPTNEGDIHPTPAGYHLLANLLYEALGH